MLFSRRGLCEVHFYIDGDKTECVQILGTLGLVEGITKREVFFMAQNPLKVCLGGRDSLFHPYTFGEQERRMLDSDGHFVLPGILTPDAQANLTRSLSHIQELSRTSTQGHEPNRFSAEYDNYLESLIAHPQMLELARKVLGGKYPI